MLRTNVLKRGKPAAKVAALVLTAAILSSCQVSNTFLAVVGTTASFIETDKLPTDYIAEAATGLDCSYLRMKEDGGPLCRDADWGQVVERPLYCYRTLGTATCYRTPDPYGMGAQHIH